MGVSELERLLLKCNKPVVNKYVGYVGCQVDHLIGAVISVECSGRRNVFYSYVTHG